MTAAAAATVCVGIGIVALVGTFRKGPSGSGNRSMGSLIVTVGGSFFSLFRGLVVWCHGGGGKVKTIRSWVRP